jgi:hypothetical protein
MPRNPTASRLRLALAAFALLATSVALPAPASAASDPVYDALRAARLDGRRVPVSGFELERDAFRFRFDSGAFHFLQPVEGRTVGAVFVGKGSYRLSPASRHERRQLALSAGENPDTFETLTDEFDELVLLFADDTAREIQLQGAAQEGSPDPKAAEAWNRHLKRQREDFKTNFHLRILQDLVNTPGLTSGAFLAFVNGRKVPPALAAVDPYGAEALRLTFLLGGEDTILWVAHPNKGGAWYLSNQRAEVASGRSLPAKRLADALSYTVDTTVERNTSIVGTTTVRFQVLADGLRVLPIYLLPELRISEASFAVEAPVAEPSGPGEPAWKPAAFLQEDKKQDADAAVVFPEPLAKKSTVLLRLAYAGDEVLQDGGDKNFFVQARTSWYPNLGIFSETADFELTYRVPQGLEIISTGRQVESRTEGQQSVSVWKTDHPIRVAGFNYGKFKKLDKVDDPSQILVEVYTNPGTPDVIREINASMRGDSIVPEAAYDDTDSPLGIAGPTGPSLGKVDTGRLAEAALADGLNSARLFTAYFGPLPQKHVAITQQSQALFGQSWPSLIYMPYISFLDGTQRQRLGLAGARDFVDQVGYHEFAHQWWGHLIGWDSYRDQWLSEGFAEFSAALAVQHTQGWPAYDKVWREARKRILDKPPGNAIAHWQAGPITQGWRVITERSPTAYQALTYSKGGYVLHMLRMLMYEHGSNDPDAKFIEMMKDFTATHGGGQPTTEDFKKVVERHMVPALNATGDGKVDWFFDQWVYGTEIPRYVADLKVAKAGKDEYTITGSISQEGVSKDFRALVPIYVEFGKNEQARVGLLPLMGESKAPVNATLKLPKKPRKALVNARGEVLARD